MSDRIGSDLYRALNMRAQVLQSNRPLSFTKNKRHRRPSGLFQCLIFAESPPSDD